MRRGGQMPVDDHATEHIGAHPRGLVAVRSRTPSARSASARISLASGAKPGRARSAASTRVTATPRRAKACASSQPTGPAPRMANESGAWASSNTMSVVRYGTCVRPGIGGRAGRAPVASTMRRARNGRPSMSISPSPRSRACPRTTSIPLRRSAGSSSVAATRCTVARTRCRASENASPPAAAASSVLDGTHPVKVQSPPGGPADTRITRWPAPIAVVAAASPAAPAPITSTS